VLPLPARVETTEPEEAVAAVVAVTEAPTVEAESEVSDSAPAVADTAVEAEPAGEPEPAPAAEPAAAAEDKPKRRIGRKKKDDA
jgi:hypothetical protein